MTEIQESNLTRQTGIHGGYTAMQEGHDWSVDSPITPRDQERSCTSFMLDALSDMLATYRSRLVGDRMLDVGCGYGGLARLVATDLGIGEAHGIDVDETVLEEATSKGVLALHADISQGPLPYPDGYFDFITSFGMLDYLPVFDDALDEIYRILKPNGHVLISLPNLASWHNRLFLLMGYQPRDVEISREMLPGVHPYYRRQGNIIGHIHAPTTRAFKELMEHTGFRTVAIRGVQPLATRQFLPIQQFDRFLTRWPNLARRFFYLGQKP